MSRLYRMDFQVDVAGLTEEEIEKLQETIEDLWEIENNNTDIGPTSISEQTLFMCGESYLADGEMEDESCRRATHKMWEVLGQFFKVEIGATCLENPPFDLYEFDEGMYKEWKESAS